MSFIPRSPYNPAHVAVGANRLLEIVHPVIIDEKPYVIVRLTAKGNEALGQMCHTNVQKYSTLNFLYFDRTNRFPREVWGFPCFEFPLRINENARLAITVCIDLNPLWFPANTLPGPAAPNRAPLLHQCPPHCVARP